MSERLFIALQYCMPKLALTRLAGKLASHRGHALSQWMICRFIKRFQVNMAEALEPDPASYACFNDFFTRPLKPGARPIADAVWVCPVDGAISQVGQIEHDQIFQAKGHSFSTQALLGGDASEAALFENGQFANIYLSPRDYHRIHMPCDGRLLKMTYIPGSLFSVNPTTARGVPGLFARNERVVCLFDTPHGPMSLTLVGATIVGSMATIWHGLVNPPRSNTVKTWDYSNQAIHLKRGEEMGRFLLGSTVVLLFPKSSGVRFQADWKAERGVRMGEAMAGLGM